MLRIPGKRARPSVITLADRARDARQWDVAARYYRVALNRRPNNPPIWVQYGHVLKESGRLTEAENAYRSALAYDWGVADTHLHLADVLRIQGKKDDAQASYLRAFSLDPSMPHPLHELGALGWSQVHLSELRRFAALDGSRPVAPPPEGLAIPSTGTRYASISQEGHWLESWHGRWRNAFRATQTFAEAIYLSCNPDVQEQMRKGAFRSGGEHWVRCGLIEDLLGTRSRVPGYCEGSYLYHNPDVASQVTDNIYPSGYHHFLTYGYSEGRVGWSFPNQLAVPTYDFPSLQARLESLAERPLISIIVPVYETDTQMLEWCIESVRRQIYPNWQLCIADDGSTRPDVRDILLTYGRLDERINTIFLDENRGISAASNAALALTSGLWVALLDHDDELTPDALLEIASTIVADPHVDVIYSDEDKISAKGDIYYDPVFKPDWSPDLLKSTMYVGHLTVHRKALISQVGGFHTEFDGTQDYDLALRVTEVAKRVHHIPKTLYHWRASPKSAAFDIANKG